ncbi:threonine--tRNA ligase, partial [Candidatus Curtissbacteria bacterium]|nr:threonine--tRNA ligase [Candidatus Curtissbacteria bacterium]
LSFSDPQDTKKYLGERKLWDEAEKILEDVARENKLDYFIAPGEAAFYGPKIDFMVTDALGREWQLATPQLDFVQPQRFGLTYVDSDGSQKTPVLIHFALMGSIERFLSVYIEHFAGKFPVWLTPTQAIILPISDKNATYAQKVKELLEKDALRVEVDDRNETLQAKIRDASLLKIPYLLVVGGREEEAQSAAVRTREGKDEGVMKVENFIAKIRQEIAAKS